MSKIWSQISTPKCIFGWSITSVWAGKRYLKTDHITGFQKEHNKPLIIKIYKNDFQQKVSNDQDICHLVTAYDMAKHTNKKLAENNVYRYNSETANWLHYQ